MGRFLAYLFVGVVFFGMSVAAGASQTMTGVVSVIWGDAEEGGGSKLRLSLYSEGQSYELVASEEAIATAGGIMGLDGATVRVEGLMGAPGLKRLRATSLEIMGSPSATKVAGATRWATLLCRFPDLPPDNYPDNIRDVSYFEEMSENTPGRLGHYWREVSYDTISVDNTVFDWQTMPQSYTAYIDSVFGGEADILPLFDDCTAAHDAAVDFSQVDYIQLIFNVGLGCCAWGGGRYAELDGIEQVWRTTWIPPRGYLGQISVIKHEMGHAFGLPHSNRDQSGACDRGPQDNSWDVMSDPYSYSIDDPVYGRLGKHTITYHKDRLGWIAPGEHFVAEESGIYTLQIDNVVDRQIQGYRMITVPVGLGRRSYTVEVRTPKGAYEGDLPTHALIIHEVDTQRLEPAWIMYDGPWSNPLINFDADAWRVGEVFTDAAAGISIMPLGETAQGYEVLIEVPEQGRCVPSSTHLCLNDRRFKVEMTWRSPDAVGRGGAVPLNDTSGTFWFFDEANSELLIKVLDGCAFTDHFWVFYAATTNVELAIMVTDTEAGEVKRYFNPLGTVAPPVQDTLAFATCP